MVRKRAKGTADGIGDVIEAWRFECLRDILAGAFPDADSERVGADVVDFMNRLARARLILPA